MGSQKCRAFVFPLTAQNIVLCFPFPLPTKISICVSLSGEVFGKNISRTPYCEPPRQAHHSTSPPTQTPTSTCHSVHFRTPRQVVLHVCVCALHLWRVGVPVCCVVETARFPRGSPANVGQRGDRVAPSLLPPPLQLFFARPPSTASTNAFN